jgi:uncharacterized membrane protein YuzA (DUF378 family)
MQRRSATLIGRFGICTQTSYVHTGMAGTYDTILILIYR